MRIVMGDLIALERVQTEKIKEDYFFLIYQF